MISFVFTILSATLFLILIIRKLANLLYLLDLPDQRKDHSQAIPVAGGPAIYIAIIIYFVFYKQIYWQEIVYLIAGLILVIVGAVDDKYQINYKQRLFFQICVGLLVVFCADVKIIKITELANDNPFLLSPFFSSIITVLAILGGINAFNMIDGMDGLLGVVSFISFCSLGFMLYLIDQHYLAINCFALLLMIIPYLIFNLGLFGRKFKIFMGDSGSTLIGFTIVWLFIIATQNPEQTNIRTLSILWFIALPLFDMTSVILRRLYYGVSPFHADREHLHHLCLRVNLSLSQTLLLCGGLAAAFAVIGIFTEYYRLNEHIIFCFFMLTFFVYFCITTYLSLNAPLQEKNQFSMR